MNEAADSARRSGAAFDARLVRRLARWVLPHQRLLWLGLVSLLCANAARLAGPWLVMHAIDDHLSTGNMRGFLGLVGAFVALMVAEFWIRRVQMYTVDKTGQNALFDLRMALFRHLQRLPASFYDRTATGRLVGRLTTDVEALQEMFSSGAVTILGDLIFLGATMAILLVLQWKLALVTFLVVPLLVGVTMVIRQRVRAAYVVMRARFSELNAYLHEQISGLAVVQAFAVEGSSQARYDEINDSLCRQQLVSVRWESVLSAVMEMLGSLTIALILWYGGGVALAGRGGSGEVLTLGALFAFVDYMQRFFQPLNDLSLKYTVMQNAMTASDRIFSLLDEPLELAEPSPEVAARVPATTRGEVELDQVHFEYVPGEPVLQGLTLAVRPGERVALVGATGAGKTSVLKLIARLYDVSAGAVRLDGVDVRDYPQRELRRRLGAVPQDVFLFEGTVLSNLRMGHPELSREAAIRAARELHLDEVVARFPEGFDAPVRERGRNLSAGERQLVAFARVLALEPRVLLLDEATANVDTHTEELLQEALGRLMEGRTTLVVAHRLSTVRDADRIFVLDHGRLVEQGSHSELLSQRGAYWRLYQEQFAPQEGDSPSGRPQAG